MCLVPPFETGPVDDVTDALQGEEVSQVEYHPVWNRPSAGEEDVLSTLQQWEVAGTRLLLQILAVILVTGIVAYTVES